MTGSGVPHFRSGRLSKDLSPLMAVTYPPPNERVAYLLEAIHQFDKAHIVALHRAGYVDNELAASMLRGLAELDGDVVNARLRQGGHIHSGEEFLTARLGEHDAGRLHTGRSSGDLYAVATRITQRGRYVRLAVAQQDLIEACLELALRERQAVMPSYTHLQHAQNTTFGHYMVGWACEALRGSERILEALARNSASPAGAAVGTGSPFALEPEFTAGLLGFERAFVNSREAIWSVDLVLEGLWVCVSVAGTWARLADDLQIFATSEFALVDIGEEFSINSSILPQKKNPIALQHIRGVLGTSLGHLTAGVTICKAPSDTLVMDRELAIEGLWHAFDDVTGAIALMAALLRSMTVDHARAREILRTSWAYASDLASLLVLVEGLSWREAQQVVSTLVRGATDGGKAADQVSIADLNDAAQQYLGRPLAVFTAHDFEDAQRPENSVERRVVPGGPAPADVGRQIEWANHELVAQRGTLTRAQVRIAASQARLTDAVREITDGSPVG